MLPHIGITFILETNVMVHRCDAEMPQRYIGITFILETNVMVHRCDAEMPQRYIALSTGIAMILGARIMMHTCVIQQTQTTCVCDIHDGAPICHNVI